MAQSGLTKLVHCALRDVGKRCYTIGKHQQRALSYVVPIATTTSISHNHAAKALLWNAGHNKHLYSTDATSIITRIKQHLN